MEYQDFVSEYLQDKLDIEFENADDLLEKLSTEIDNYAQSQVPVYTQGVFEWYAQVADRYCQAQEIFEKGIHDTLLDVLN